MPVDEKLGTVGSKFAVRAAAEACCSILGQRRAGPVGCPDLHEALASEWTVACERGPCKESSGAGAEAEESMPLRDSSEYSGAPRSKSSGALYKYSRMGSGAKEKKKKSPAECLKLKNPGRSD